MRLLLRWAASTAALLIVAHLVPGLFVDSLPTAAVAAAVIGLVNAFVGPILRLLSFPITVLTLGLFSLVVSAVLFGLAAYLVPGFSVDGVGPVFVGAIGYGVLSWLLQSLFGARKKTN